jgi:hypothetical protein
MTIEAPPAVPQMLAERFAKAFAAFVDAVRAAAKEAALDPALNTSRSLLVWQTQDLPRLEKENAEVQNAMALYLAGETHTIVAQAAEKRHLARELDGCDLNFAGPDKGMLLDQLETAVVVAAYQVCAAAKVP